MQFSQWRSIACYRILLFTYAAGSQPCFYTTGAMLPRYWPSAQWAEGIAF